jgi:protein-disulfide isomerase
MKVLDRLLSMVLTAAALVMVLLVVREEFEMGRSSEPTVGKLEPVYLEDWRSIAQAGRWIGTQDADVVLVAFGDYECPFCGRLHTNILDLLDRYPHRIAVSHHHFPLAEMHRFALPAAKAVECAAEQDRFEEMHDAVYQLQDSLGLKPWRDFAIFANVGSADEFEDCLQRRGDPPAVRHGVELGKEIGVQGTPAVIVNGEFFPAGIDAVSLRALVERLLEASR